MSNFITPAQRKQNIADHREWSKAQINAKQPTQHSTKKVINPNGSTTFVHSSFQMGRASTERIDGHFWIEDLQGNLLSDCGFNNYKKNLPIFKDPEYYDESKGDFVIYQPALAPNLEEIIIQKQLQKKINTWGRKDWEDGLTDMERFEEVAMNLYNNKATMLNQAYNCLQYAFAEWIGRGKDKCRIRFGSAGCASKTRNSVYWFFGHINNATELDWCVPNAVDANGEPTAAGKNYIEGLTHLDKVPAYAAVKVREEKRMQLMVIKRAVFNVLKTDMLETKSKKAEEALLADWGDEEKPKKKSKGNKSKGKGKK